MKTPAGVIKNVGGVEGSRTPRLKETHTQNKPRANLVKKKKKSLKINNATRCKENTKIKEAAGALVVRQGAVLVRVTVEPWKVHKSLESSCCVLKSSHPDC